MYYRVTLCILLVLTSIPLAADQAKGKCPYPLFPELYEAVKQAIDKGDGSPTVAEIDKELSKTVTGRPLGQADRLEQLFILRTAACTSGGWLLPAATSDLPFAFCRSSAAALRNSISISGMLVDPTVRTSSSALTKSAIFELFIRRRWSAIPPVTE